jgi:hypothetical protein
MTSGQMLGHPKAVFALRVGRSSWAERERETERDRERERERERESSKDHASGTWTNHPGIIT